MPPQVSPGAYAVQGQGYQRYGGKEGGGGRRVSGLGGAVERVLNML